MSTPTPAKRQRIDTDEKELALLVRLVGHAVDLGYADASEAFKQNPNAINWGVLQTAMHAHQFWHFSPPAEREAAARKLCPLGIGQWLSVLKTIQGVSSGD